MAKGSQTETHDGSGRNQQQSKGTAPPPPKPGKTSDVAPNTPKERANGGAHPAHVRNR